MLIHLPTERERNAILTFAWIGNELDPAIEASEMHNSFFVSGWDFTEATLNRLGIKVAKASSRERIRKAFYKAHEAIVKEFVDMKHRNTTHDCQSITQYRQSRRKSSCIDSRL